MSIDNRYDNLTILTFVCVRSIDDSTMACLLIGSSHIERLRQFLPDNNPFQLSDNPEIQFHGISGGRVLRSDHVQSFETVVGSVRPSRIVMQIGGNDLDSKDVSGDTSGLDIDHIVLILSKIAALARLFITRYHVNHVVICQFLFRETTRHVEVEKYNSMVLEANRMLKDMLQSEQGVHYWKLKGLKEGDNLFVDGVHLSSISQAKYSRNIRGAIIHSFD